MSTNSKVFERLSRTQRGVAAVEFAVILPVLIVLLTFPIFFGRVFMHYGVIQRAAHDAAVYYAGIPIVEMSDQNKALAAAAVAETIIDAELAELKPGSGRRPVVQISCDNGACGDRTPALVTVNIRVTMYDDYFNNFTWMAVGPDGIGIEATVTVPYYGH